MTSSNIQTSSCLGRTSMWYSFALHCTENKAHRQLPRIFAFTSNKINNRDTLIYISRLIDSKTQNTLDSAFNLPMTLITPPPAEGSPTARWSVDSFSVDDHYLLVSMAISAVHRPLYVVDISGPEPGKPELIVFPNSTLVRR